MPWVFHQQFIEGIGEMVEVIKFLLCKCEDPSLIPRIHTEKLGVVGHICNPRAGVA